MAERRHTAEQIISKLREAEDLLAKDAKMPQICRNFGVTEQTYYRWRKGYRRHQRVQAVQKLQLRELGRTAQRVAVCRIGHARCQAPDRARQNR
jgi:putative transposase